MLITIRVFGVVSLSLLFWSAAYAQGVGSSGDIKGTVTDQNKAGVQNVTIIVRANQTGLERTTSTNEFGEYRVPGLLPTVYDVTATSKGFEVAVQKGVTVGIGETAIVDFQLAVSQVTGHVQVNWESPLIDTERAAQANTIQEKLIRNLPIDRRDYLTYALLAPGISDSQRLTDNTDFRVKQTPQSGLSVYGSNGRGNSITVDGGEANDNTGGVVLTLSQDAVQEFQINRSNYSAELGGASGASINIVSKSGTNDAHGSLFIFVRNAALDASDPFAFNSALDISALTDPSKFSLSAKATPVKPHLNRQQFGGSIGFPVRRDRSFLFVAYEGLRRREQNSVPLLTDSSIFAPTSGVTGQTSNQTAILNALQAQGSTLVNCVSNQPAIPSSACASVLRNILTINPASSNLKAFWVEQFITNTGVFPFRATQDLGSARFSHQFSSTDQFFIRYNFGRNFEQNANLQALVGFSQGNTLRIPQTHTILGAWFHEFSPRTINEARAQFLTYKSSVIPNDPGGPQLEVNGFGSFGRNIFLPSFTRARRWEFADNVTVMKARHRIKFGAYLLLRGTRADSHVFLPGRFSFGDLPGGLVSPCLASPTSCGLPSTVAPATINALQSAALGLPSFYQQGFGSGAIAATNPLIAGYWEDSWAPRSNVTLNFGIRYEFDKRYAPLHTDANNFAPRGSLSWDPFRNHKTVVRAGYGLFFAPIYFQIDSAVRYVGVVDRTTNQQVRDLSVCLSGTDCFRQIAQVFIPLSGVPGSPPSLTSAAVFQTLFSQGRISCGLPAAGDEACIRPTDLTQFGINITHEGAIPPLTVLFSGDPNYQNSYSQQAEISIERELARNLSLALTYVHARTLKVTRARDKNLRPAPFLPTGPANIPIRRWNGPACAGTLASSCFVNPLLLQDNLYEASGKSFYDGAIVELNKRFGEHSSLIANYTFSKAIDDVTDFNSDFQPNDQTNLAGERALSPFDQRHKLVVAAVMELGAKQGNGNLFRRLLSRFTFSPVLRGNSGRPFNLLTGTDLNGDRHSTTDRPPGAGRNTGRGTSFWTFDMRVARQFELTEKVRLQVTAEGFNIFNRTNFASLNNVVGPNFTPPYNVTGREDRTPSQPLGFTAAYPKRQIQLGARISF